MKPNKKQTILVVIVLCIISFGNAQTVDDIISKHLKAHGDIDKWDKVESIKITGRFTAFSVEDDFFAIKTKDGKYYSELQLGKHGVTEAFDGKLGWTIDPWQDFSFPRELNKNERNVFVQKAEFFTPFYNYKENGCTAELLGKQVVDGIDVFAIKLERPSGFVETWYLDANTFLEYKRESRWVDFTYGVPAETYFDDFREVEGIIIPFFSEKTFWQRDRVIQIENIELNVEVDESLFTMPRSSQIEKLDFLIGDWGVQVNVWSMRANRWYKADTTSSKIEFVATNLIQEKISYIDQLVQSNITNFSFNSSTGEYFSTVYSGFSSEFLVFNGNFTDSTFVLQNINMSCDSSIASTQIKATYSDIKKDSFIVNIVQSTDNGINWMPGVKLVYRKISE